MAKRGDDRVRNLVEVIERAIAMARDEEQEDVETLLEAALETILVGPAAAEDDGRVLPFAPPPSAGRRSL